jgi:hypothetical protein
MKRGEELIQTLQSNIRPDWNVQQTDNPRYAALSRDNSSYFDIQVGPRYDGELAVVATHRRDFGSEGVVPYPVEYRRAENVSATVEAISKTISMFESQHWSVRAPSNAVPVEELANSLVDNEVEFAAIPEDLLAYGICGLLWAPSNDTDVSAVAEYLQGIDAITVGGRPLPFAGSSEISLFNAHFGARVPLYASGESPSTTDTVERDEGLAKLREYDFSASPQSTLAIDPQTTSLESLLEQLVNGGAVAIALEKEVSRPEHLVFSVYIPPEQGYNIVAESPFVKFEDSELGVDWVCQMDGPHFSFRVPVYVSEDISGLESVSLPKGLTNLRKFISGDTDAAYDVGDEL